MQKLQRQSKLTQSFYSTKYMFKDSDEIYSLTERDNFWHKIEFKNDMNDAVKTFA